MTRSTNSSRLRQVLGQHKLYPSRTSRNYEMEERQRMRRASGVIHAVVGAPTASAARRWRKDSISWVAIAVRRLFGSVTSFMMRKTSVKVRWSTRVIQYDDNQLKFINQYRSGKCVMLSWAYTGIRVFVDENGLCSIGLPFLEQRSSKLAS